MLLMMMVVGMMMKLPFLLVLASSLCTTKFARGAISAQASWGALQAKFLGGDQG